MKHKDIRHVVENEHVNAEIRKQEQYRQFMCDLTLQTIHDIHMRGLVPNLEKVASQAKEAAKCLIEKENELWTDK